MKSDADRLKQAISSATAVGTSRIRVMVVLPDLSGGGAQRVTLRLLRFFDARRFALTLLVLSGPGQLDPYVPVSVRLLYAPQWRGVRVSKLATLWHARGQDVLVAATELRASFCVHFAARWLRKPSIGWVRIAFDEYAQQISLRNRRLARATYGNFDRLVFVSEGALRSFSRWYGGAEPGHAGQWRAILNVYEDAATTARNEPVPGTRPLIVGIGRIEARKGFDLLIRAAGIAHRQGADFDLAILGEGALREELRALAAEEGIGDRLLMPGFVHDVSAWLSRSTLYVLSSRIEGLPGTILESFAAGVPVIATRCPHGPEELLQQGACGVLVPMDDAPAMAGAIGELLASPRRRRELAALGQQRLRDFMPAAIVPQWESLIDELVAVTE